LNKAYIKRERIGRRTICNLASMKGLFISEQDVRNIFRLLEELCLVNISRGRGGTVITEEGKRVLNNIVKNKRVKWDK